MLVFRIFLRAFSLELSLRVFALSITLQRNNFNSFSIMRNCMEQMGNIIAVHLIAPGELTFSLPFNVRVGAIPSDYISVNGQPLSLDVISKMSGFAVDTYYNNVSDEMFICMENGVSVKESPKKTIAGVHYDTKISLKTYDAVDDVRHYVDTMAALPYFDVIIRDSSDHVFILRGAEPAVSVSLSAALPVTDTHSVEVEVFSVNGLMQVL